MLTTSLLSLVPDALDVLSDDDVPSDAELLLSVDVVDVVDVAESVELAVEASLLESLAADVICGGGGGGTMPVSVVSPEVVSADVPVVEVVDDEADEPFGGGGGGGAMAALLASPESPDTVVLLAEVADDVSEGGGCIVAASVPPICSWRDNRADCISLPSDEKALPDDTVPDVELPVCPSEEGGVKAVAADVPLLLDDPKRAARLPVLLVKAERDDICCLRGKLPLQLRRALAVNQARKSRKNTVNQTLLRADVSQCPAAASRERRGSSAGCVVARDMPANNRTHRWRRGRTA